MVDYPLINGNFTFENMENASKSERSYIIEDYKNYTFDKPSSNIIIKEKIEVSNNNVVGT